MREVYVNFNDGYVFNNETKKLEFFKFKKAVFNFESGKVKYYGTWGGVDTWIATDTRYKDEESFKRGIAVSDRRTVRECNVLRRTGKYLFEDGKAIEIPKDIDYEVGIREWDFAIADGRVGYWSMEEAYDFNDITVKYEDGTEKVITCAANKTKLTEKQELYVKQFNDLVNGMIAEGMAFIYDESYGCIKVINKTLIETMESDCDRYCEEGWSDIKKMYTKTELGCSYTHDDDYINAKFKE